MMDALTQFSRVPTELEEQLGRPTYTPRVGMPDPLPSSAQPSPPWYILLMQALGEWVERGGGRRRGSAHMYCFGTLLVRSLDAPRHFLWAG
jgi:hypothetical protein